ncbi:hypothetical protein HC864_02930 [Candidatus Gracilibacteria bacterium]|nr:hypothetical protein [Thermales bacterium]NJL96746.1 hypothetical protein [Candidatus Gracilibacteria bacterium]
MKRIKVTKGGDLVNGKLLVERINDNHRLIRKSRVRKLKARRKTTLGKSGISKRLKAVM